MPTKVPRLRETELTLLLDSLPVLPSPADTPSHGWAGITPHITQKAQHETFLTLTSNIYMIQGQEAHCCTCCMCAWYCGGGGRISISKPGTGLQIPRRRTQSAGALRTGWDFHLGGSSSWGFRGSTGSWRGEWLGPQPSQGLSALERSPQGPD